MDVDRAEDPRQPDSEGSGDDLRPGQAAVDSSEEESDNSEAVNPQHCVPGAH
jgi:hypothetical protein